MRTLLHLAKLPIALQIAQYVAGVALNQDITVGDGDDEAPVDAIAPQHRIYRQGLWVGGRYSRANASHQGRG